jgi:hypothetical protein
MMACLSKSQEEHVFTKPCERASHQAVVKVVGVRGDSLLCSHAVLSESHDGELMTMCLNHKMMIS